MANILLAIPRNPILARQTCGGVCTIGVSGSCGPGCICTPHPEGQGSLDGGANGSADGTAEGTLDVDNGECVAASAPV